MKRILCISFAAILLLFLISEFSIWTYHNLKLKKENPNMKEWIAFNQNPLGKDFEFMPEFFPNPQENWGRAPEGLEYKGKPIVIFGGSTAYGYNLNKEQTFSFKLANEAKRPVYNRAVTAWGIQHMLEQSRFEELYEDVPNPEYIIYVYTEDQLGLLFLPNVSSYDFLFRENNLRFKNVNGAIKKVKEQNKILSFIKSTYTAKAIKNWKIKKFIIEDESKNSDKINFALSHFLETKEEMGSYWKDSKFVVFFYDNTNNDKLLKSTLEDNGFITISAKDLTNEDLRNKKYFYNNQPTEDAWNLLTPLIIKKLEIK